MKGATLRRRMLKKRIAYFRESGPPELGGRAGRVSQFVLETITTTAILPLEQQQK